MSSDTQQVRVLSLRDETADIRSFELVPASPAEVLPDWQPGAHIEIQFPGDLVRAYSLCGAPAERNRYRIAVKRRRDSRGGSEAMHMLKAGDLLRISHPRQRFGLNHSARHHLLVAGGIGITPLLAMFRALETMQAAVDLHYFARSEEDAAFFPELDAARRRGIVHGHFGLSAFASIARLHGLLGSLEAHEKEDLAIYTCAPHGLMTALGTAARATGLDTSRLRLERFAAEEVATIGTATRALGACRA